MVTLLLSAALMSIMKNSVPACFITKDLTKTYQTGETQVCALRGANVTIPTGEIVVILGPSGSGKSTFLNIIGGIDQPTSGEVWFRDTNLTNYSRSELTRYRREHVGFVFQSYNLVPSLTAYENVALITEIARNPMNPEQALAIVGLNERLDHFPAQMSGGEQQRVAIARALAKNPEVLFCDEPTGALDSVTGIKVLKALLKVNEQYNTTCVIITHNASIGEMADQIIYFKDGLVDHIKRNHQRKDPEQLSW
jgi:putative ABC transport system ATP-binding protein